MCVCVCVSECVVCYAVVCNSCGGVYMYMCVTQCECVYVCVCVCV